MGFFGFLLLGLFFGWLLSQIKDPFLPDPEEFRSNFYKPDPIVPKDWFVYEASQNAITLLWAVCLVNQKDLMNKVENPRQIVVTEHTSYNEALQEAINQI